MMRKYKFIGTLAFYLTLPGLFFYLQKDERSRVIVEHKGKILVLKSWYGSNKWMLPGGGMHDNEQPLDAAIRELKAETGIQVTANQLAFITSGPVKDSYGLRYKYHLFVLKVDVLPQLAIPNIEIFESDWLSVQKLIPDSRGVLKATRATLQAWLDSQKML